MVDRPARDKMAELWKHLIEGSLTVGEFADRAPVSTDPIICHARSMFEVGHARLLQKLASDRLRGRLDGAAVLDVRDLRLTGVHALHKYEVRVMERLVLFLGTDLEFEPAKGGTMSHLNWWQAVLLTPVIVVGLIIGAAILCGVIGGTSPIVGLLLFSAVAVLAYRIWGSDYWPFRCRSDYRAALRSHHLFTTSREHRID